VISAGLATAGAYAARVCMAAVFLYSGQDKVRHWNKAVGEVRELHLPGPPALMAASTIVAQLIGGVLLLTGVALATATGAALLAAFTAAATLIGHRYWLLTGDPAKAAFTTFLEHLAITGGLLLVIVEALRIG
jgi:putative oxidoreductase